MKLSKRIQTVEGSKTARFIPLLDALKRQGRSVISLAVGEPTDDTPGLLRSLAATAPDDIRVDIVTHELNHGIGHGRNSGIDAAIG